MSLQMITMRDTIERREIDNHANADEAASDFGPDDVSRVYGDSQASILNPWHVWNCESCCERCCNGTEPANG